MAAAAQCPGGATLPQVADPNVATAAEMLFPRHEWHPTLAENNTSSEPFETESFRRYKPRAIFLQTVRSANVLDCSYYCRLYF